jgi:hypothetical protein
LRETHLVFPLLIAARRLSAFAVPGLELGSRAILVRQLARKFGQLPTPLHEKLDGLLQDKLEQLADAVLDFSTVADVQSWLGRNG